MGSKTFLLLGFLFLISLEVGVCGFAENNGTEYKLKETKEAGEVNETKLPAGLGKLVPVAGKGGRKAAGGGGRSGGCCYCGKVFGTCRCLGKPRCIRCCT